MARTHVGRWAFVLALTGSLDCCGVPPAPPPAPATLAGASGCYVVLRRKQVAGDSVELLFPDFFGLDSAALSDSGGGYRVLLPPSDLTRFAGSWSWRFQGESLAVSVTGPDQGFSLSLQPARDAWEGRLTAWVESLRSEWMLRGRRVQCPRDLTPAGTPHSSRSSGAGGGAASSGS